MIRARASTRRFPHNDESVSFALAGQSRSSRGTGFSIQIMRREFRYRQRERCYFRRVSRFDRPWLRTLPSPRSVGDSPGLLIGDRDDGAANARAGINSSKKASRPIEKDRDTCSLRNDDSDLMVFDECPTACNILTYQAIRDAWGREEAIARHAAQIPAIGKWVKSAVKPIRSWRTWWSGSPIDVSTNSTVSPQA